MRVCVDCVARGWRNLLYCFNVSVVMAVLLCAFHFWLTCTTASCTSESLLQVYYCFAKSTTVTWRRNFRHKDVIFYSSSSCCEMIPWLPFQLDKNNIIKVTITMHTSPDVSVVPARECWVTPGYARWCVHVISISLHGAACLWWEQRTKPCQPAQPCTTRHPRGSFILCSSCFLTSWRLISRPLTCRCCVAFRSLLIQPRPGAAPACVASRLAPRGTHSPGRVGDGSIQKRFALSSPLLFSKLQWWLVGC